MRRPALLILMVCCGGSSALADLWSPPPARQVFVSKNKAFRLEIVSVGDQEGPARKALTKTGTTITYENGAKVTTRANFKAGQLKSIALETRPCNPPQARLRLFRGSTLVWKVELDWFPASAVVADSGRWVATFDHWNNRGLNPHVVVLLDGGGRVTRAFTLDDLFTSAEQAQLSHSVRSIWWAAEGVPHIFSADEKALLLQVQLGGHANLDQEQPAATKRPIDLATGKVLR